MKLRDIIDAVDGELLTPNANLDQEIDKGFGSDLMSDVLALIEPGTLLITGLIHPQSVRAAEMADVAALMYVRNKQPLPETLAIAAEADIPVATSRYTMFEVCGRLYAAGLAPLREFLHED